MTTPKIEQTAKNRISLTATFSFGKKQLVAQNRNAPTTFLNTTKAIGFIWSGITAFAIEKFMPKIILATSKAICDFVLRFLVSIFKIKGANGTNSLEENSR